MSEQVITGDCLEELSLIDQPIAAILTDPPYASGARTEAGKAGSGAMVRGARWAQKPIENDQMTTAGFVWTMRAVLRLVRPKMAEGGSVLCFIDWRQWPNLVGAVESADYRINSMIVWDKVSMGMGAGFRAQHELILHASRGVPTIHDRGTPNVIQARRDGQTDHPSPKPVGLLERLIRVVTKPGDLVVDPFLGAGATAIACKNTGRRCIGIESIAKHCETATRRLAQCTLF
jgi:site-specific DNA-methyltransferase (adenine-specific)